MSFAANKMPETFEIKAQQWINFGWDKADKEWNNRYPEYLLQNYQQAPTHAAICGGKINYTTGRGLKVDEYSKAEDLAKAKGLLSQVNEFEDADQLNAKLSADLIVFGGFFTEVIPNKSNKLPAEFHHLSAANFRVDKDDNKIWYYTDDWKSFKPQKNEDFKTFHIFEGDFEAGKKYILHYRGYRAGDFPYALPDYISANSYIESEWRIANYLLNNIKNGFSAGYMINFFNGEPTPEEADVIEGQIKKKFTGDDAGGSFVVNFGDKDSKSAEIIPMPTNGHDDRFNLLKESIRDNLFTAHQVVSPMLFGVRVAGTLGGRSELLDAFNLFLNTYINTKQDILIKFWNDVLDYREVKATFSILQSSPMGEDEDVNDIALALGNLSPLVATRILEEMTPLEIRGLIGLKDSDLTEKATTDTFSKEHKEDLIISHFESCGVDDDTYEVMDSMECNFDSIEDAKSQRMNFAETTSVQKAILDIFNAQPNISVEDLARAIDLKVEEVEAEIAKLKKSGLLKIVEGKAEVKDSEVKKDTDKLIVVYKYALRKDAPTLVSGGRSRDFCIKMMALSKSKSWTIEQIEMLSNGQGLDVFNHRGGWLTKKGTDISVNRCRHIWNQRLVKIK